MRKRSSEQRGQESPRGQFSNFFTQLNLPQKNRAGSIIFPYPAITINLSTATQTDAELVYTYFLRVKSQKSRVVELCDFFVEWVKASNAHPDLPWSFWALALTSAKTILKPSFLQQDRDARVLLIENHFKLVAAIHTFKCNSEKQAERIQVLAIFFVFFAALFFMVCPHVIFSFPTLVAFLGSEFAAWAPIVFGGVSALIGVVLIYQIVGYFTKVLGPLNEAKNKAKNEANIITLDVEESQNSSGLGVDVAILKQSLNRQIAKSTGTYLFSFWPDFSSLSKRLSASPVEPSFQSHSSTKAR